MIPADFACLSVDKGVVTFPLWSAWQVQRVTRGRRVRTWRIELGRMHDAISLAAHRATILHFKLDLTALLLTAKYFNCKMNSFEMFYCSYLDFLFEVCLYSERNSLVREIVRYSTWLLKFFTPCWLFLYLFYSVHNVEKNVVLYFIYPSIEKVVHLDCYLL